MPTLNPRVNITFEPAVCEVITALAKREHKSVASFARELIIESLERREDKELSELAELRNSKKGKLISHEDAWK